MARERETFENDVKALIKCLTDIQEEEENFQICQQFITTNFKYHKFLGVDSHKVTRAADGMYNKFLVHSQDTKAKSFKKLTDAFLEGPIVEGECDTKTDTHYSLLLLLLNLANSPTDTNLEYREPHPPQQEVEEDFDWGAYLLEGEQVYQYRAGGDSPLSDWSDDDSESEDETVPQRTGARRIKPLYAMKGKSVEKGKGQMSGVSTVVVTDTSQTWLKDNLVDQYWQGAPSISALPGEYRASNLAVDWEHYQSSINPVYVSAPKCYMTEEQILREVLWMLGGEQESFIFEWNEGCCSVREDVEVCHLTQGSLQSMLSQLGQYGELIQRLQKFIQEASEPASGDGSPFTTVCQTYQAFASGLSGYLQTFQAHLANLQSRVMKQEETMTLGTLLRDLLPWLQQLDLLGYMMDEGVQKCSRRGGNVQRAAHLLSVMYHILLHCDVLDLRHQTKMSLLLPLWLQTIKPYIDIIDNWISLGQLRDPCKEFFMQRNKEVRSLDESFWETAVTVQMFEDRTNSPDVVSQDLKSHDTDESSDSEAPGNMVSQAGNQFGVEPSIEVAPDFLAPVLEEVSLAGKSMELLQDLGRLQEALRHNTGQHQESLFHSFVSALKSHLGTQSQPTGQTSTKPAQCREGTKDNLERDIAQQMEPVSIQDQLLQLNFANIFQPHTANIESLTAGEDKLQRELSRLDTSGLSPLQLALKDSLYPSITAKYQSVCLKLLDVLKQQYKLMDHLAAIRHIYLMELGDVMYDFYTEIFDKLRLHEPWQDVSFLNITLQDALQRRYPQYVQRFFVSVEQNEKKETRHKQPIHALDGLTLHYKMLWPVDVVLNSKCLQVYNQIFSFLLQIKRAKYSLDELKFEDLEKRDPLPSDQDMISTISPGLSGDTGFVAAPESEESRSSRIHRMHIFRMKLLHFVNSLNNYIMTRTLHTTGLEFLEDMDEALDLEQLMAVHNSYVTALHQRCLLHHKVQFLKDTVTKVLNQALSFQTLWDQGVDAVTMKTLQSMETDFQRCVHFLASFLNNIIKRGSFPHLESLAFALCTTGDPGKVN